TEVPALASDDRPGADPASGAGQGSEPLPGRARLLQPRRRADQSRHLRSAGLDAGAPPRRASPNPVSRPAPHVCEPLDRSGSAPEVHPGATRPRLDPDDARPLRTPDARRSRGGSAEARPLVFGENGHVGAVRVTADAGCKMVAETTKGSAAATANPLSLRGCRGWI